MTNETTDANTTISDYEACLKEAAEYIRTHREDNEIPVSIIVKALGKRPAYCDSTDEEVMHEALISHTNYTKNINDFISKATEMSYELQ